MSEAERKQVQINIYKEILRSPKKHAINVIINARGALNELLGK